ncbi:MAG: adenosine deaminase [Actinobacteria bacterium]|nr:adenosine deaminase [Actinomycetota bacterium]
MTTPGVLAFVEGLPKAELHVHMLGAASVETVLGLSRRYPEIGLPQEEAAMRDFYRFTDFAHFIEVYDAINRLVRTADDVHELSVGLGHDLAAVGVRYAEVTVTADSHLRVGIPPDALSDALARGRADVLSATGVELAWVFDIDGDHGIASGERTLAWAQQHAPKGSIGFGLGGSEAGVPRSAFADIFRRAREIGLHSVPHAGETVGPEQVWASLDHLGAERIGHGIAAAQDLRLMEALVERDVALEVCPTSNVSTKAVRTLEDHAFPVLREAGVRLTVNTDDPGMFATDLNTEYLIAHEVFGLDVNEISDLARESVRASFAPDETRARILAEIDAYAEQHRNTPDRV